MSSQSAPAPRVIFMTGVDHRYFLAGGILLESLADHFPDIPLVIMDFGLTAGQRAVFEELGVLRDRPEDLSASEHPYRLKSASGRFIEGEADIAIWIDADIIALRNGEADLLELIDDLIARDQYFAWAADQGPNRSIGEFRRNYDMSRLWSILLEGESTPFSAREYANAGLILFVEAAMMAKWEATALELAADTCWEQNALNLIAYRNDAHVTMLHARVWNVHSELLDRLTVEDGELRCEDQPVTFVHATSANRAHIKQMTAAFELDGETSQCSVKILTEPMLEQRQLAYLTRFLERIAARDGQAEQDGDVRSQTSQSESLPAPPTGPVHQPSKRQWWNPFNSK